MPAALAARNWTFFRPDDDFAAAVDALVVALDTDLDWVRAHTRLLGRSLEWESLDRDSSFLLRGRDLDDAEQWAAARSPDHEPQPTPLQLEYVLASRSSATRRQRITVAAALVAVVVAASLALLALVQRNEAVEQQAAAERQARLALSRQLAAQSEAALDRDPEQSVVLAARAATTAATDEARDQLRRALRGSRLRSVIDARRAGSRSGARRAGPTRRRGARQRPSRRLESPHRPASDDVGSPGRARAERGPQPRRQPGARRGRARSDRLANLAGRTRAARDARHGTQAFGRRVRSHRRRRRDRRLRRCRPSLGRGDGRAAAASSASPESRSR